MILIRIIYRLAVVCFVGCVMVTMVASDVSGAEELVLVADGESHAPVAIFEDAPAKTRRAADELAEYIDKTSGVRPEVLVGEPDTVPENAIWVGYQSVLDDLFPGVDLDFQHPEGELRHAD